MGYIRLSYKLTTTKYKKKDTKGGKMEKWRERREERSEELRKEPWSRLA